VFTLLIVTEISSEGVGVGTGTGVGFGESPSLLEDPPQAVRAIKIEADKRDL
jgi:hypothetical protein